MKTDTNAKILAYIKENKEVSAKDIIAFSGFSPQAVFRQLKVLQNNGKIYKIGKTPKVRYYAYTNDIESKSKTISNAINWVVSGADSFAIPEQLCQTQDVFRARTDRLLNNLKRIIKDENLIFLLVAIIGEIGNNSFDHNLGQWTGVPGVLFIVDEAERLIILADRGQGVFATLKRVRPNLINDQEALKTAFTETISGRAPENRGNGLKFVKKVIIENNLSLEFHSGQAVANINQAGLTIKKSDNLIHGTLSIINF